MPSMFDEKTTAKAVRLAKGAHRGLRVGMGSHRGDRGSAGDEHGDAAQVDHQSVHAGRRHCPVIPSTVR